MRKPARQGERIELDSRQKIRRDRMMSSKNFETQEVKDRPEESRRVERLFHLMDGNNRCLLIGSKRM